MISRSSSAVRAFTACILIVLPACADTGGADDFENEAFPPPPEWRACGEEGDFECATLGVPLEYDTERGDRASGFTLQLIRRPAGNPHARKGSIVINPGGPGGSGAAWVYYFWRRIPEEVSDLYDIVGFDPRGVGLSEPTIECGDNLDKLMALDLTPDSPEEREAIISETQQFVDDCAEKSALILPYVGTENVVRDLERIRLALQEYRLNYVGFSYGTFIGALYAERYPKKVRAFVLDGAVDPALSAAQIVEGQALGFEMALDHFLNKCASDAECQFHSAGDPYTAFDALQAEIEAAPMPAAGDAEGRSAGPGEFFWAVTGALYGPNSFELASALSLAALEKDSTELLALSDKFTGRYEPGHYSDSFDQYHAIFSIDNPFPRDMEYYDSATEQLKSKAPRLGASLPYTSLPSAFWPIESSRIAAPVRAEGTPPILVLGNMGDPATPYEWSVSLADHLDNALLLTLDDEGHTAFGNKSQCINDYVAKYLIELKMPTPGTRCY